MSWDDITEKGKKERQRQNPSAPDNEKVVVVTDNYGNPTVVSGYTYSASSGTVTSSSGTTTVYEYNAQQQQKAQEEAKKQEQTKTVTYIQEFDQSGAPKQYSTLTPDLKKEYGLENKTAPEKKNFYELPVYPTAKVSVAQAQGKTIPQPQSIPAPTAQKEQSKTSKEFGGISITQAPKKPFYSPVTTFLSETANAFISPSAETGEKLRTGTPSQKVAGLLGTVGFIYSAGAFAETKAAKTTINVGSKIIKAITPGKTALKVAGVAAASDVALYPIAKTNPTFKQNVYQPYVNLQIASAELYLGAKTGRAIFKEVAAIPAFQNIGKALGGTKLIGAGEKVVGATTFTAKVGKIPFTISPLVTGAELGAGLATYKGIYAAQDYLYKPRSNTEKQTIRELAALGYAGSISRYGGQEEYRNKLEDFYKKQGLSSTQAESKVNNIFSATAQNPFVVENESEKAAIDQLRPSSNVVNGLNQFLYMQFDFLRLSGRSEKIFGYSNPLYQASQKKAELRPAYDYARKKGFTAAKTEALIADVEAEMTRRDISLSASNLAINTYSEVVGQTVIYPTVFKEARKLKIKSGLKGRTTLAVIGLNTAPLGFVEGATQETTRQIAFGENRDYKRILEMGTLGAGSSVAIQSALFATTPIKAKQTGKLQKVILYGSYVADAPYEFLGDVTAEKMAIPALQRLRGAEFERPVFIRRPDESLIFGLAKGEQPVIPRFRTLTGTNILSGVQSQTQTQTQSQTQAKARTQQQTRTQNRINQLQTKISNNIGTQIFSQVEIPTQPQQPTQTDTQTQPNIYQNIFAETPAQTQAQVFSNIPVSTPIFRIPPPIPLGLPTYEGGGSISGKERRAYLNELERGRQLINNLVGMPLYKKPIKTKTKKRKK